MRGTFPDGVVPFTVCVDIFESFVGALFVIGGSVGFLLAYKFISYIMGNITINIKKAQQGPGVTLIDQMFSRLQIPTPKVLETSTPKSVTLTMTLTEGQQKALKDLGFNMPKKICTCTRQFQKHAQKDLYDKAVIELEKMGLDHHYTKERKSNRELSEDSLSLWRDRVSRYIAENGLRYIYKVQVQFTGDDPFYLIRILAVKNGRDAKVNQVFAKWTTVTKPYSTLYAYSMMFPEITTRESIDLQGKVNKSFDSLPRVQGTTADPNGSQWIRDLRSHITTVLKTFLAEKVAKTLVTRERMKLWKRAFTDESFTSTSNNTQIVQLGQNVLKAVLSHHMYYYYPRGDPGLFSNITTYILEEQRLATISERLGLNLHIRCIPSLMRGHTYIMRTALQGFLGTLSQMGMTGPALCIKFGEVPLKSLTTTAHTLAVQKVISLS